MRKIFINARLVQPNANTPSEGRLVIDGDRIAAASEATGDDADETID